MIEIVKRGHAKIYSFNCECGTVLTAHEADVEHIQHWDREDGMITGYGIVRIRCPLCGKVCKTRE